jgi:hypothetical protein
MDKKTIIKNYDYVEFSIVSDNNKTLAIYNVDVKTLKLLRVGNYVKWNDKKQNFNTENHLTWNAQVDAIFNDFIIITLL